MQQKGLIRSSAGAPTTTDSMENGDHPPNPCLGHITEPPFFAVPVGLGANGTRGGLAVDAYSRVLDNGGNPVAGLFAVGEQRPPMGPGYAGSGASLGPALTAAANTFPRAKPPPHKPAPPPSRPSQELHPLLTVTPSTRRRPPRGHFHQYNPPPQATHHCCRLLWACCRMVRVRCLRIPGDDFGKLSFPNSNPVTSVLSALAVFGVAFLARPVGAIIFGHLGDRFGRRVTLSTTILMMGAATACIRASSHLFKYRSGRPRF